MPYTLSNSSLDLEAISYDILMISICSPLIFLCVLKDNLWRTWALYLAENLILFLGM